MPYRDTMFLPRNCYHIYNRGNHKEAVFFEEENYRYFLRQFQKHLPGDHVLLLAYCLMPNHYHFLVELIDHCDISSLMRNFIISYTKAINKRYDNVGHLFQGRFKCKPVETEEYLLNLTRYIHNNPTKALLVRSNELWKFSSYAEYLGLRAKPIVNIARVMELFRNIDVIKRFTEGMSITEFRKLRDEFYPDPPVGKKCA